ncbi:MAG: putative transport system permease protein [Actinomycetota bacterium]|jgi:putative ABC transport system permease protein|nr:putative transport system permease protein [Actinomycetota bacterium]
MPIIVGVVFLAVVVIALLQPMLRRLGVRDATRRPRETALVIAGSLLGTALITGSFVVGDTLDSSIRSAVRNQLGPIDEIVQVPDATVAARVRQQIASLDDERIDGVTSLVGVTASFSSHSTGEPLAEPEAKMIELDFTEGRDFGADPTITGIEGDTPQGDEVVIGVDLANRLSVAEGDEVTAFLYGKELKLQVTGLLPRRGIAGFWLGFESTSPNAFVAPGTISKLAAGAPKGASPPTTTILVSNRGGVEDSGDLSVAVKGLIEDEIGTTGLRVEEVKRRGLENADEQGDQFGQLFLGIGSFAIIAGILLLVNIFVMLAEERKSQLGMLRAVGMKRSHLVRAFVIEGAIYAFLSSLAGAAVGIGVGWAIVKLAAPIFGGFGDFSLDLIFHFDPDSLITGFCAGALISMLTIFITSLRISRINIIRAIRDLPEPKIYRARTRTVIIGSVLAAALAALFVMSLSNNDMWPVQIAGPPLVLFALLPLASRMMSRRIAVLGVALLSLLWGIFGDALVGGSFFESGDIFAFVIQGTLLTFSAVIIATQTQENLEGVIRRVSARSLPLRLSVAYPLARRGRTGLTLGMFALVIFTMTFIAVLSNVFGGQVDTAVAKESGFDVLATSSDTNPPTESQLEALDGVENVASLRYGTILVNADGFDEPVPWTTSAIDQEFVDGGPPLLTEKLEGLSEDEVWQELLSDPGTIVVPSFFLQTGGGPPASVVEMGDTIGVIDPVTGVEHDRRIIGEVENDFAFSGSYVSYGSIDELLGPKATASRFYIEVADDSNENAVAKQLQGELVANGVEAESFRSRVEDFSQANLQFFRLMQSYLALGLLVGIAGLGVVMVRAVRERRRDVGVLRALGFMPKQVRRAFVLESGFVALQGILIGAVLALITASQLVATGEFGEDIAFDVPWIQLGLLTGIALVASLLATAWPAQEASKIPPAVALRIAD